MCIRCVVEQNKCIRGSLESVEGEFKTLFEAATLRQNVVICDVMIVTHESEEI